MFACYTSCITLLGSTTCSIETVMVMYRWDTERLQTRGKITNALMGNEAIQATGKIHTANGFTKDIPSEFSSDTRLSINTFSPRRTPIARSLDSFNAASNRNNKRNLRI
ncbi:hypothetical protein BD410DRAFT_805314 [Rickenella mellea]|uniref:Uncharacterized protein n=1 Tax=Rickenella mellea TaxID=50990 RepID=A0A4Y7PXC7_9AGAM|nr:hypothetical protein BD410DRAFT_805314 [Rickenella mellea]